MRVGVFVKSKQTSMLAALWVCLLGVFYWKYYNSNEPLLSVHSLNEHRQFLCDYAQTHAWQAAVIYMAGVAGVIALTVPGATTLSFAGGVIFPQPQAAIYAYVGFVVGACLSYWMVRTLLRDVASRWLHKVKGYSALERKLKDNSFLYLIYARYTLVFPFWFVNGTAAMVGVNFRIFAAATALAVIPGSLIYTTAGRALSSLLDSLDSAGVKQLSTADILYKTLTQSTELKFCLCLLALSAAVPLLLRNKFNR